LAKVSIAKNHPWSPPKNGLAISPLLQSHYLRFESEVVPATAAKLLNEALGQPLVNKNQGRRLIELYGRHEAVIHALITPLSKAAEQRPVLRVVRNKAIPQEDVIYAMFNGVLLPYNDGYHETKVGRDFLGRHIVSDERKCAEAINHRRRVENSEYVACEGHYSEFTKQFTPLVKATQQREKPEVPTVVITNGAIWMADYIAREFPKAAHILDFFHAFEHLAEFAALCWPRLQDRKAILERWKDELRNGKVADILNEVLTCLHNDRTKIVELATGLATYLRNNLTHMAYAHYRAKGYLVGSRAIESAARSVVQQRYKQTGQRWGQGGAKAVLNIRAMYQGGKHNRMDKIILVNGVVA
jgi:hypothetical protein